MNEGWVYSIIESLPMNPNGVALDIGANRGVYSYRLAKKFGKVIAIEPVPDNYEKIIPDEHIEVVPMALSHEKGQFKLYTVNNPGGHTLNKAAPDFGKFGHSPDKFIVVNTTTLDELVGDRKIDFIKCDVEGAEETLFDFGLNTLRNNDLTIVLETHRLIDLAKLYQLFIDNGYINIIDENNKKVQSFEPDRHYLIRKTDKT